VADLLEGTRIEVNTEKRHPADFALWKKAGPEHIMQWNSAWGSGFPGWHVECSAMSTKYLGQPFDIHGGGLENTFPHHECEIAQSEAATGKTFARYWMHNNMVTVNGVKMGKSLGNFITIHQAMENLEPMAIRFFILSSHYRSPLDFSDDALTAGQKGFQKILTFLRRVTELVPATDAGIRLEQVVSDYQVAFENELCDDFNTPKALAVVFDFIREMNSLFDQDDRLNPVDQAGLINVLRRTVGDVLGLLPDAVLSNKEQGGDFSGVMELLLELRQILRREKNFALADQIRQKLTELKIEIKDTADGSRWEKK
jgi:cysteinyl-tRNA synthetase